MFLWIQHISLDSSSIWTAFSGMLTKWKPSLRSEPCSYFKSANYANTARRKFQQGLREEIPKIYLLSSGLSRSVAASSEDKTRKEQMFPIYKINDALITSYYVCVFLVDRCPTEKRAFTFCHLLFPQIGGLFKRKRVITPARRETDASNREIFPTPRDYDLSRPVTSV